MTHNARGTPHWLDGASRFDWFLFAIASASLVLALAQREGIKQLNAGSRGRAHSEARERDWLDRTREQQRALAASDEAHQLRLGELERRVSVLQAQLEVVRDSQR